MTMNAFDKKRITKNFGRKIKTRRYLVHERLSDLCLHQNVFCLISKLQIFERYFCTAVQLFQEEVCFVTLLRLKIDCKRCGKL